jgi:hypothetical protein
MKLTGLKQLVEASGAGGVSRGGEAVKLTTDNNKDWTDDVKMVAAGIASPPKQLAAGLFGMGARMGGKQQAADWTAHTRNILSGGVGLLGSGIGAAANAAAGPLPPTPGNVAGRAVSTLGKIAGKIAPTVQKYGDAFLDVAALAAGAAAGNYNAASYGANMNTTRKTNTVQQVKIV